MSTKANLPLLLPDHVRKKFLDHRDTNRCIAQAILSGKPFLAARFGSVEGQITNQIILQGVGELEPRLERQASRNAGIVPASVQMLRAFATEYMSAAFRVDLLGIWSFPGQMELVSYVGFPQYTHLRCLNPMHFCDRPGWSPWTRSLEGMRVLVVHPFQVTIEKQLARREQVATVGELWPKHCDFSTYKPAVTFAGENQDANWMEELARMKREIAAREFDVALIGAGAYGMPLGRFVKDLGRSAIHLGGETQLLFGIIGARWERREHLARAMGQGWVRPSEEERPRLHDQVDNSSYW